LLPLSDPSALAGCTADTAGRVVRIWAGIERYGILDELPFTAQTGPIV
jgi:hypothetical protein